MDQQLSERGLSLRPFDPEVFARVWSRVMPDQALSPIQPALPALRSPALAASAPEPSPAPSCLGEGSARYAPQLEALMDQLHTALSSVRQLARRGGGRAARPAGLPRHRPAAGSSGRLAAAYFLITGRRYAPKGSGHLLLPDRCPPPCAPCFDRPSNAPPRPPVWPGPSQMIPVSADCWRTSRTRHSPMPPRSGFFWRGFCKNFSGHGPPPVVKWGQTRPPPDGARAGKGLLP